MHQIELMISNDDAGHPTLVLFLPLPSASSLNALRLPVLGVVWVPPSQMLDAANRLGGCHVVRNHLRGCLEEADLVCTKGILYESL